MEHGHVGGQTGLCTYALLKCGVAPKHPGLRRAFSYLDNLEPTHTYSIACMMLAYSEAGEPHHVERVQKLLRVLIACQASRGTWAYPHKQPDLSNTQYAALGLWAAAKAGLKVPAGPWNRLIQGTLRHQEKPKFVQFEIKGRTGARTSTGNRTGKREVAGFSHRSSGKKKCTGTMTTAGISILKICEIGLGTRLGIPARRRIDRAISAGLNWMDVNFSVTSDQAPGSKGSKWLLYYLYGMECVGGLCRVEQFGDHWWFLEGARLILERQKGGGWGEPYNTSFALLFLRRATTFSGGPTTGGKPGDGKPGAGMSRNLYSAGTEKDSIQLRGAGQEPLMIYIKGFGPEVMAAHSEYGLRIMRVEYLDGRRKIGHLAGDPTRVWKPIDTFMHRCESIGQGGHEITARVIAVDPKLPSGDTSKTVTIDSLPMDVKIRDVIEPWMDTIATMQQDNLLKGAKMKVIASSNPKQAALSADGLIGTQWKAGAKDAKPTLTFEFKYPITARRLILTQALQSQSDLDTTGIIRTIEVSWNKSKKFQPIEMHPNPLAPTVYEMSRSRKLFKMTIRVVDRGGKAGKPVGFAEIVLESKRKAK